jgi:predicted RNA binding protein YcfA (HicA-like mRNA interferase family)
LQTTHVLFCREASANYLILALTSSQRKRGLVKFSELVRLLEQNGFRLVKEKGSIRYYSKRGIDSLIRIDYHASKEVPTGTCQAILKAAGLKKKG